MVRIGRRESEEVRLACSREGEESRGLDRDIEREADGWYQKSISFSSSASVRVSSRR